MSIGNGIDNLLILLVTLKSASSETSYQLSNVKGCKMDAFSVFVMLISVYNHYYICLMFVLLFKNICYLFKKP